MKNVKKIVAMAMAAALCVVSLTACGGSSDASATFVIGGSGPLTGPAAVYGIAVKNGAQIAVDEINAAGGVNGMTLELNFQDDEHDAEKAVNAYNTVKDAGAKVFLGTVTSTPCEAVVEKTKVDNMFQLTPSGSSVKAVQYENAFRICFSDPGQGTAAAQYIGQDLGLKKVAIIWDNSDVYSTGIYEKFKAEAASAGLEIVSEQSFQGADNKDFNTQLIAVNEAAPDIVFLPIYYQAAALILQQANQAGFDLKFFGCDGLDGIIGQLEGDAALAEGVMLLTPFVADDPDEKVQSFVKTYQEKFNEVPNQFAADAYDGVYVIKAALEDAGVKDASVAVSELCDLLKASMVKITVEGITGTMTWNAEGEPTKDPRAMYIENGSYKAMD